MKVLQSGKGKYKMEISLILNNIDLTNKKSITIIGTLINEKGISYDSSILSIVETYFNNKNDVEVLKELITSKNNSILNIIQSFVKHNNINKFIYELKTFLINYKERLRNKVNNEQVIINNNIHNNNQSYSLTGKWSIKNAEQNSQKI